MRLRRWLLIVPLLALAQGGCAARGPALEAMDAETLFAHAMEELENRQWESAARAFERFVFAHPNHPRVQEARFRIGETYQGRREWITAALEFNRLAAEYPAGPWADDARFQVCRSYYELSPRPQLDQEYTYPALEHCQSLLAYYPDSEHVPAAQEIIVVLTNRLAEKDFLIAEGYVRQRALDSAIIYFEDVVRRFPASDWAPRALLRVIQLYERLEYEPEARAARERLLQLYPNSPEARQVGGIPASAGT
jgi:outer membrane protein assembly factor BamD